MPPLRPRGPDASSSQGIFLTILANAVYTQINPVSRHPDSGLPVNSASSTVKGRKSLIAPFSQAIFDFSSGDHSMSPSVKCLSLQPLAQSLQQGRCRWPQVWFLICLAAPQVSRAQTAQFSYALGTVGGGFSSPYGVALIMGATVYVADRRKRRRVRGSVRLRYLQLRQVAGQRHCQSIWYCGQCRTGTCSSPICRIAR